MAPVKPFVGLNARLVGNYSRAQSAMAWRSGMKVANQLRSEARMIPGTAASYAPIVGLGLEAGRRAWGIVKRVGRRIKGVVTRKSASQFKQIDMASYRKRRYIGPQGRRAKRVRINDPASYKQLASVKRKYGRKVSNRARAAKLWRSVTSPYRLRFGRVQDINAATGTYWLTQQSYGPWPDGSLVEYVRQPVYLINLTSATQGNVGAAGAESVLAPYKMWELATGITAVGQHRWFPVPGIDPIDGASTRYTGRIVTPTESNLAVVGRKGLLDWTRLKLCFWGKKKNPTNIRVRIIRFLDEEFCPETTIDKGSSAATGGVSEPFVSKVAEFWSNELKYLLNGHMGGYARFDRSKYIKVLKEFTININPIDASAETTGSDPRGHMKHLDIFNRWNRVIDYTDQGSIYPQTLDQIQNVNQVIPPGNAWTGYPKTQTSNIYCLIESVQPAASDGLVSNVRPRPAPTGDATGTDYAASFDVVVEQNFTIHDPFGATAS